jgi:uncharacterized protein (DUF433 family)
MSPLAVRGSFGEVGGVEELGALDAEAEVAGWRLTFLSVAAGSVVYLHGMSKVFEIDSEILGGTPVFSGTRVPIESLFDHLEEGVSLHEFVDDFPTVTREQAVEVLEMAGHVLTAENFASIYETVA